jgi:hypothetical protein
MDKDRLPENVFRDRNGKLWEEPLGSPYSKTLRNAKANEAPALLHPTDAKGG